MISVGITINRFNFYLIQAKLLEEQRAPLHDVANTGISRYQHGHRRLTDGRLRGNTLQASQCIDRTVRLKALYSPHHLAIYIISGIVIVPGVTGLYWLSRR